MNKSNILSVSAIEELIFKSFIAVKNYAPLVHCLTNTVVQEITANTLLAAGAAPAMVPDKQEAPIFAQIATGLLVNVGTYSSPHPEAIMAAVKAAQMGGTPWVLDPVAVGGLEPRTSYTRSLLEYQPTAIRGNASEIIGLVGAGDGGRGVDSADEVDNALMAAWELVDKYDTVVAISGPVDAVVSKAGITRVQAGHQVMTKVVGTGCALGALVAAYVGAVKIEEADPRLLHAAVVAAHAHSGVAGSIAAEQTTLPGSFKVAWLDGLAALTAKKLVNTVVLTHQNHRE